MYDYLLAILSSLVLVGLILFIISNAFNTRNYKIRALINFLVALILLLCCVGGYFYDVSSGVEIKIVNYIIFPGAVILESGILLLTNLIKAKHYHHHLRGYRHRQIDDLEQFLYLVYKVDSNYYLKFEDDKYRGEIIKFYRKVFFHDEMVRLFLEEKNLVPLKAELVGTAEMNYKKKHRYFCYLVELNEAPIGYHEVNQYTVGNINTNEIDKQIILRIVIGEEFNIKV